MTRRQSFIPFLRRGSYLYQRSYRYIYIHKIPHLICMGLKPSSVAPKIVETTFDHGGGAGGPSGHGGSTYIRRRDELRAVLTPSVNRNYPLISHRQGRHHILNPNAQSQDKRGQTATATPSANREGIVSRPLLLFGKPSEVSIRDRARN